MPTYEYTCDRCGHGFEQFQSIAARPLKKCPQCGGRSLRRLIGAGGGIIFRGSGFYETDYRSESYRKAAEAEKKSLEKPAESKRDAAGSPPTTKGAPAGKRAARTSRGGPAGRGGPKGG